MDKDIHCTGVGNSQRYEKNARRRGHIYSKETSKL